MATRTRIEFISSGFRDLLMSDEVGSEVMKAAGRVARRATSEAERPTRGQPAAVYVAKGPVAGGYGGGRQIAYVSSDNRSATRDAIVHMRLERVIWEEAE